MLIQVECESQDHFHDILRQLARAWETGSRMYLECVYEVLMEVPYAS